MRIFVVPYYNTRICWSPTAPEHITDHRDIQASYKR